MNKTIFLSLLILPLVLLTVGCESPSSPTEGDSVMRVEFTSADATLTLDISDVEVAEWVFAQVGEESTDTAQIRRVYDRLTTTHVGLKSKYDQRRRDTWGRIKSSWL